MKRMFAMILALAMLAVSAAMAEGDSSAQSETTQTRMQETVQQGRGPGRRRGPGKAPGTSAVQPGVNDPSAAGGTTAEQPDATSQATAAKGADGSSADAEKEGQASTAGKNRSVRAKREKVQTEESTEARTEKKEMPSGEKKNGTRPANRGRASKAGKPDQQGEVKAPEAGAETPNDLPETGADTPETNVPAVAGFEAMAESGVISGETLEEIRTYIEKNSLEAADAGSVLEKLLEDSVITKAEYDAMSAAR